MVAAFVRELVARRVPHAFAIYAAASWGCIEFVSFVEERYMLSPHWTDLTLLCLGLLVPSVLLFSYNHGKPGKDTWRRSEKIGIPLNLIVAAGVIAMFLSGRSLNAVTTRVSVQDESGNTVERVIPRSEFRKNILFFPFDFPAATADDEWLRFGMPSGIQFDLLQDVFIELRDFAYIREQLREAGFPKAENVPLPLKQKLADGMNMPYFVTGTIARAGQELTLQTSLYETDRARLVQQRSFTGSDFFRLFDQASVQLKRDLGIPDNHIEESRDLPAAEILTSSAEAYRNFAQGMTAILLRDDYATSEKALAQAVALDPTFAFAQYQLYAVRLVMNQSGPAREALAAAMDHIYRFPERIQFAVKADNYFVSQEHEKALAVARMKVELFPDDVQGYLLLTQLLGVRGDKRGMIQAFEKIIELDPNQRAYMLQIGALQESLVDDAAALETYSEYVELEPQDSKGMAALGDLQQRLGKHEQARASYEKALLLEPDNAVLALSLAALDRATGRFDEALQRTERIASAARTQEDRIRGLDALADHHIARGQISRAIEVRERRLAAASKIEPALAIAFSRLNSLDLYVQAGRTDEARRMLAGLRSELTPPFNTFVALGEMDIAAELEDAAKLQQASMEADKAVRAVGFNILMPGVLGGRGRAEELQGRCNQAIALYKQSLELERKSLGRRIDIGRCHRTLGQYDQSIASISAVLRAVPYHGRANYEIGLTYLAKGDRARARAHLQRALQVWAPADPAFKLAADARAKLAEAR